MAQQWTLLTIKMGQNEPNYTPARKRDTPHKGLILLGLL